MAASSPLSVKKILACIGVVVLGILLAGIFGIIHDQFTYTISEEYYTQFKFPQFQLPEYFLNRTGVALVGFGATWWVGLLMGILLSFLHFRGNSPRQLFRKAMKSMPSLLLFVAGLGLIGLLIGYLFLDPHSPNWIIPDTVEQKKAFLAVGAMHTLGYIGGLVGILRLIILQIRQRRTKRQAA